MRNEFVEQLKLDQANLKNFKEVVEVRDDNITTTINYNFLIKALEIYNDRKFDNNERVTEFIKINLSQNEEIAKQQWFDGIEYDGHTYKAWFATVGGMKEEDKAGNGICDTIFIREDYIDFAEKVEELISLGKFKELEGQEICINKDVLSRLSLITSDLITEIDMPNFIVLPSAYINYIEDYKTVRPIKTTYKNDKGEEVKKVDYELVDYHFDTDRVSIDEDGNLKKEDEIECFDGGGIATPEVFKKIGQSIERNDIEFAIVRAYGNATKGLITKFDIIEYLNTTYNGDTAYLKRVDGQYYLLDRWNDWRPVTANTMLLNDSMVKLAKYFDNMEDYTDRIYKVEEKYKGLLNKLYITKVNKADNKLSDYRRTNYQLINALAITPAEYTKLSEQDFKMLKKIIKPYDLKVSGNSNKEFEINTNYIKLFFKNTVDEDISADDVDYEQRLKDAIDRSIVDKVNELISLDEDFVKLESMKSNLRHLVEKKIRELASGKVTVKGKYQYMACCPISYMNFAMYRNQGENGLAKGEFYSADCKDGDIRTISRNPLAAYSEVHNVKFVRNELLDKYLSPCRELIYFNQKSDIQNLLSSADFDGDGVLVIDNDIIRDSVVVPKDGKYFITLSDGKKKNMPYNAGNRFISTYKASGNLIGKIALKAANINSNCQNVPVYYIPSNKNFINWNELLEKAEEAGKTKDELQKAIDSKLEKGEFLHGYHVVDELKQKMIDKFYEYEKEIYIVLYNSMKSIDATKTLVFPDKADMEVIDEKYFKKVDFLKYTEQKENVEDNQYVYTYSVLDRFAQGIQFNLLETIEKGTTGFRDRADIIQKKFKNNKYDKDKYDDCFVEVEEIYTNYTEERKIIQTKYSNTIYSMKREKQSRVGDWKWYDEDWFTGVCDNAKEERNKSYKELDQEYIPLANKILNQYDLATICQAISNLSNCTENFILTLFFKCFTFINTADKTRFIYQKDDDGDIEFLHERYKAIPVSGFDNSNVIDRITNEDMIRAKLEERIRFRFTDKSIIKEIDEALKNGKVYNLKLDDERISIFEEFMDAVQGKTVVNITKFDLGKNGKRRLTKKSAGVIIEK